jgi:putative membrane protein
MKGYNVKNWKEAFRFNRHDTLRSLLPLLLLFGLYTFGVDWWLNRNSHMLEQPVLRNLGVVHGLLGFVISLLLVFRTNTAYDRWWEGRKLWGNLINTSRNLSLRIDAALTEENAAERAWFRRYIPLYAAVLDRHLKSENLELSLDEDFDDDPLDRNGHLPNQVASRLHRRIMQLHRDGSIGQAAMFSLQQELGQLTDICGACERIKNTPIPFSYASFIKRFILLYLCTLPWSLAVTLNYWNIPVLLFVMYALSSLEVIAEEIEEPFGNDPNDLPTGRMAERIRADVHAVLQ